MANDIEIRPFEDGDVEEVLNLYQSSYDRPLSKKIWEWRFRKCPSGKGMITLAWHGSVLASHSSVTPCSFRIEGEQCETALSGTTMTHPDFRGRGLFVDTARFTYDRMAEVGMKMVWGFPNQFSHRGIVRDLLWEQVYEIPHFRLNLPLRKKPALSPNVVEVKRFGPKIDELWQRTRDRLPLMLIRDAARLNWRFTDNPKEYRFLTFKDGDATRGYLVFHQYESEYQITDILMENDEIGVELVGHFINFAIESGKESVALWFPVHQPFHHSLEKMGFVNDAPVTYFGGRWVDPNSNGALIRDYRNWYITMSDSDVY